MPTLKYESGREQTISLASAAFMEELETKYTADGVSCGASILTLFMATSELSKAVVEHNDMIVLDLCSGMAAILQEIAVLHGELLG